MLRFWNEAAARRLSLPAGRGWFSWRSWGAVALLLALGLGYIFTGQRVAVVVNGQPYFIRTHHLTVEAVVQSLGLVLYPEDRVQPESGRRLSPGQTITIQLARPVLFEADGRTWLRLTHQQTVAGVLAEAGLTVTPRDKIFINETNNPVEVSPESPLPSPAGSATTTRMTDLLALTLTPYGAVASARPERLQLLVRRAIPVTVVDGRVSSTFYTTQPTLGKALLEQGLTIFLGDVVTPGLETTLSPGMRAYIQRAIPVTIKLDGRKINTRTQGKTVGQVLAQEGVTLMGQDFSRPPAGQPITADLVIEVVRVCEALEIAQEFISFETNWIPDDQMNLDQREERQPGVTGVIKTRTRLRYENNQEVLRRQEDKWLDQEPINRVVAYGTKVVIQTLDTPDGPLEYWRKISMLLTPYTAASSGKSADHPLYGITRTGERVGFGIAAVDPKVIPLGTRLYVPGYGRAVAADTGGLIVGKHIDLAFDEGQPIPDLYGWGEVYILTPVPSADRIRYVLPQYPQQ